MTDRTALKKAASASLTSDGVDEPMVLLRSSSLLEVIPIWEQQIDEIEGPLYAAYITKHPEYCGVYVRASVAKMLEIAARELPKNWQLIVRAGHRPIEVQEALLLMVKEEFLASNKHTSEEEALAFARSFVSDPSQKTPPHCSGAAVDVDVRLKSNGDIVDFGTPVNTDTKEAGYEAELLTFTQQKNREVLTAAMLEAGFAPFYYEWWHFSFGDSAWAAFYGKKRALYDLNFSLPK